MDFKIKYQNKEYEICEDFIDVGYMAENFEASDCDGNLFEVKRSNPNRSMTLLISFPMLTQEFREEILELDTLLNALEVEVHCYLIFNESCEEILTLKDQLKKLTLVFDTEEEFGNMYGTKIISGDLNEKLTKSLFLISKDGSIFFIDMPKDITNKLNLERLRIELNKAYITYTGVGCHG